MYIYNIKKINYSRIYYILISLFALFLPLSRAGTSIISGLLLLTWLLEGEYYRKFQQIINCKLFIILIAYMFLMVVSLFWTENFDLGVSKLQKLVYFFLIFIFATSLEKRFVKNIISMFLIGMFISEIIAYGAFFEFWTFKNATSTYLSPIMHHTHYSVFMAVTAAILLNRLFSLEYTIKEKVFFLFFFLTISGNLFLSPGRTGQVALIFGIVAIFLIHFRLSFRAIISSFILIVTLYIVAYNTSKTFNERVNIAYLDIKRAQISDFSSSLGIRIGYWLTSYDSILENPFGSGVGDYKIAINEQLTKDKFSMIQGYARDFMSTHQPHNQYLLVLIQVGLLGFFLFLLLIGTLLSLKIKSNEIKQISILFTVIYFISCMAESLLNFHYSLLLFVFYIGVFSVFVIDNEKENNRV